MNTRPNITFTTLRLIRFNINPSPKHYTKADRAIRYLVATQGLVLQYRGGDTFEVVSDASFADNILDQKSL